ncbi:hypothetical protein DAPPUDRAFT_328159 [Daphnia pulex]|uniref:Uncharacterized protein n=1 Tax=Daphnia pulex TaxID=6669 RepID=E9HD40_DAPPU|nr:hypothetical protein DAPPUDRAFT_328159 [Daphnia pulex]|eukprot:EFX70301.1 hypothetical protein DAPPUDRAFT_328159 [Daphnia pulex]
MSVQNDEDIYTCRSVRVKDIEAITMNCVKYFLLCGLFFVHGIEAFKGKGGGYGPSQLVIYVPTSQHPVFYPGPAQGGYGGFAGGPPVHVQYYSPTVGPIPLPYQSFSMPFYGGFTGFRQQHAPYCHLSPVGAFGPPPHKIKGVLEKFKMAWFCKLSQLLF